MSVIESIIRLFRPRSSDGPLPERALEALRAAVYAPTARITVEFCSGTPFWEDENYYQLMGAAGGDGLWQDPFLYRLFLITGEQNPRVDYDRCQKSWQQIVKHCPSWPGLREDRITPKNRDTIKGILAEAMESL